MYHARIFSTGADTDPRPVSAVGRGVGVAGCSGLIGWLVIARWLSLDGPYGALMALLFCAVPMIAWSLLVDRVHRRPGLGIDWDRPRPLRGAIRVSVTKLAGLWATWTLIALAYATFRFYQQGGFGFATWCLAVAAPGLFALSIPYVIWLDRYLVEPRDGAWHCGAGLLGRDGADPAAIAAHCRAWAVKAFFLAFMLAALPVGYGEVVRAGATAVLRDPVALVRWLMALMFVVDVVIATVGYILTFRPLDAHIRSANPFMSAWVAALICYPPFILMAEGGPLDYHPGTADWRYWFAAHPVVQALVAGVLVVLTAIYAWATVAFGLRFSNLTNRGIITHGPYAWTRHPAYLSKNLFWWLSTLPFLSTAGLVEAGRATLLLGMVSGVYYWRAKTEERHLSLDPDYRAYSAWMDRRGAVPRAVRALLR